MLTGIDFSLKSISMFRASIYSSERMYRTLKDLYQVGSKPFTLFRKKMYV